MFGVFIYFVFKKDLFLLQCVVFAPLSKMSCLYLRVCFWFLWPALLTFFSACHLADMTPAPSPSRCLEAQRASAPACPSPVLHRLFLVFWFPTWTSGAVLVSTGQLVGILNGVALDLQIKLGRTDIMMVLSHPVCECGTSFRLFSFSLLPLTRGL